MLNSLYVLIMTSLSVIILLKYFQTFLGNENRGKLAYFRWSLFFLWQYITIWGIKMPAYQLLIFNVFMIFIVSFNFGGTVLYKLVFTIINNAIGMLMEFLAAYMIMSVGGDYIASSALGGLLSKAFMLLIVILLINFFKNDKISVLPSSYMIRLLLIPLASMYVSYNSFMITSQLSQNNFIISAFITLIIMFVINILIFSIYLKLSEHFELRRENIAYKQQLNFYNAHQKEKEQVMLEVRQEQHDRNHHLIHLINLIKSNKYDLANRYLELLLEMKPKSVFDIADTDNDVIDALVNYKYSISKEHNIEFNVKLEVPTTIPFDDTDMSIILGNALDNAIEANLRIPPNERFIKILIRQDRGNLIIVIDNAFDGGVKKNKAGKLISSKQDPENHNIGLSSIQKSVDKYQGFMQTEIGKKIFTLKIVLYKNIDATK